MTGTMTWVGLDVHARSTHGAAINSLSGELHRVRFGAGVEPVIEWLAGLPGPVRAVYEAGPTGFGLKRAADAAGIAMQVVAPGKTPRAASDRVKTDRKDAELLARLLLAGQLSPVFVPDAWIESVRHLARRREQVRADVMRARHRISKLLLVEGRVYGEPTTWNVRHRQWLSRQTFDHEPTELVFVDLLAALDGLVARRDALEERLSRLAQDGRLWPAVARLRCFRGVDTLTALTLHLELGADWQRFNSPRQLGGWLGLTPSLQPVRAIRDERRHHQDRLQPRPPAAGRVGLALHAPAKDRRHAAKPPGRPARPRAADRLARSAPALQGPPEDARPRQAAQPHHRRRRPRTRRLSLGRRHRPMT
ncbi:MAG TPA: IS110 family transposase [Solirubrobacteraceae bacterium]|nr:IS110 family transposase [Solirubrobacteraceae bacterium]